MYEQEVVFYSFHKQKLTNEQWYKRFNAKVDTGSAIGVTRHHKILLKHVAQQPNIKYDDIPAE